MKTEAELKKLAEFLGNFLKLEQLLNSKEWKFYFKDVLWLLKPKDLFGNDFGPLIAHLALQEMEKEYDISYMTFLSAGTLTHQYFFSERRHRTTKRQAIKDENKFIALWSAIEQTGEK